MYQRLPRLIFHGQGDDIRVVAHGLCHDGFEYWAVLGNNSIKRSRREERKGPLALGLQTGEQILRFQGAHVLAGEYADDQHGAPNRYSDLAPQRPMPRGLQSLYLHLCPAGSLRCWGKVVELPRVLLKESPVVLYR